MTARVEAKEAAAVPSRAAARNMVRSLRTPTIILIAIWLNFRIFRTGRQGR